MAADTMLVNALRVEDKVSFIYHDKRRDGTVEKVTNTLAVVRLDTPDTETLPNGKTRIVECKSFRFDKMENLAIEWPTRAMFAIAE